MSARLLSLVGIGLFEVCISVPLVLEYEDALLRVPEAEREGWPALSTILDYICSVGLQQDIHFLWRPCLRDPKDDMVLELAVASGARVIVTYNQRDFSGASAFAIDALAPREFLARVGGLP